MGNFINSHFCFVHWMVSVRPIRKCKSAKLQVPEMDIHRAAKRNNAFVNGCDISQAGKTIDAVILDRTGYLSHKCAYNGRDVVDK